MVDFEVNDTIVESLKDNKLKQEADKNHIVGPYNKLFQYFIRYYKDEKSEDGVSDFMKQIITQLLQNTREPDKFNFLSYLVLQGKEEHLKEALTNKNIQYLRDQYKNSPIDYAIKRFDHRKTNMLISYLIKNPDHMKLTTHQQLLELLEFSPSKLVQFFDISITQVPGAQQNGIDFDEDKYDFITVNQIDGNQQKIEDKLLKKDADEIKKRPIDINQLYYPLNLNLGSDESILLQLALQNCKRQNIYETKAVQQIIEYKWQKVQTRAWLIALFQFSFVIFITLHLYLPGEIGPLVILFIYAGLFLIKESFTTFSICCVQVIILIIDDRYTQFEKNGIENIEFSPEFYQQNGPDVSTSYNIRQGALAFYEVWLTMLGQGESQNLNYFQQCYYILVTFILQVTLLNILVAQYGDTFTKFQEKKEIIDGQVKNNIIIEIEIWTFNNRKAQNHEILVWMEYDEDEDTQDEVKNSKILEVLDKQDQQVNEFKKEIKTQLENQEEKLSVLETKLKDQYNNILVQLQNIDKKHKSPQKKDQERSQSDLKEFQVYPIQSHPENNQS